MRKLLPIFGLALLATGAGHAKAQDAEAGKRVFNKCRACHAVDQEQNRVGPHLVGLFGRDAGAVEDYSYSDVMAGAGITWTDETLAAYLADPRGYMPGNKMTFVGIDDEEDMQDLLAYRHEATGS